MAKLRVTLRRSPIGFAERQKRTIRALGLGRMHKTVVHPDNPQVRGMVNAVKHLVTVETVETDAMPVETAVAAGAAAQEDAGQAAAGAAESTAVTANPAETIPDETGNVPAEEQENADT